MEKKQSAVQWLMHAYWENEEMINDNHLKIALQMEQEQIVDAHVHGHNAPSSTIKQYDAQQYFNETYGGKK